VVVGRTHRENEAIKALLVSSDLVLRVQGYPGPLVLVLGDADGKGMEEAALLAAAYSDAPEGVDVAVSAQSSGAPQVVRVTAAPKSRFKEWLI
jgi:predicted ribosome quality control (RQC) complex YloA/Tae2 family protein